VAPASLSFATQSSQFSAHFTIAQLPWTFLMFPLNDLDSTMKPSEEHLQSLDSYSCSLFAVQSRQPDAKYLVIDLLRAQRFHAMDFKFRDRALTWSSETVQASIYASNGRQGIASAGLVSHVPQHLSSI
jgi:hypothetical protein